MRNKKGLERSMIVGIVIIVIVLGILVYFLIYSNLSNRPSRETCHQAILARGMLYEASHETAVSSLISKDAANTIALKCKTEDVEISNADKDKMLTQIADQIVSCWSMLGEGKINFFGESLISKQQCLICARIKFSDDLRNKGVEVSASEVSDYMLKTNMPGTEITYTDFLAGAKEHLKYAKYDEGSQLTEDYKGVQELLKNKNINLDKISSSQENGYAIIYTMWTTDQLTRVLIGGGVDVGLSVAGAIACYGLAAGLTASGVGTVGGLVLGAACISMTGVGAAYVGSKTIGVVDDWRGDKYIAGMVIVPYSVKGLESAGAQGNKDMTCTSFDSIAA